MMHTPLQTTLRAAPLRTIIMCILILNLISLLSLYSSLHRNGEFTEKSIFYKQVVWLVICWLILIVFSLIHYRLYFNLSLILYALNIILLISVIIFGKKVLGAQRWLSIFGLDFQPSEISKVAVILILARFLSAYEQNGFRKAVLIPLGLVIANSLLIFKQPDLGTALIILFLFFMLGASSQIKKRYFVIILIVVIASAPLGWNLLKEYQKKRLAVFVNPSSDPLGAGYTIIQSKIAIGSGRIFGKGFLSGTQNQFNFLPERHTDFIFTVVSEEWGLVGSLFVLFIYWILLSSIFAQARQLKDSFAQLITLGISHLFFLHIFINIGMTLGILPVVGLPLIFISYGGTHLVVSFLLMGIFFNIYRYHARV